MIEPISPPALSDLVYLGSELVLSAWGVILLMVDLSLLRRKTVHTRFFVLSGLALLGIVLSIVAGFGPDLLGVKDATGDQTSIFGTSISEISLFSGTLFSGPLTERMDLVINLLLAFVVLLSVTWSFTEHVGEYFALLFWAAVGMMLLIRAEELLTLFLTLEMMTICLYVITAFEKGRIRSIEGGLKYFVYGSVSSALFLFGLSLIYGLTGSTRLPAIGAALLSRNVPIGLAGNIAGGMAVLLVIVGFGFKLAAVPFHQWAPDTYEGAPAPVSAWIATGSKVASVVAMMKVLLQGLGPYSSGFNNYTSPGWVGLVAVIAAVTMTYGNFAALAQKNLKRMLAYSSIAHAGYMLVGILSTVVSKDNSSAAGSVIYYLIVYAFANIGAFAVAAWLIRDKGTDEISDLNGLGYQSPGLAVCILLLMLSLIGMPPLAGFFGKLYMFMEAVNSSESHRLTFLWLVGLGLMNSVVSAFYYVRVLKAMFLRPSEGTKLNRASFPIGLTITVATVVSVFFGIFSTPVIEETTILGKSRSFIIGDPSRYGKVTENAPAPVPAGASALVVSSTSK